jgi:hypothetical protein
VNATISRRDYYEVNLLGLRESEYDTAGYGTEFREFLKIVKSKYISKMKWLSIDLI